MSVVIICLVGAVTLVLVVLMLTLRRPTSRRSSGKHAPTYLYADTTSATMDSSPSCDPGAASSCDGGGGGSGD